MRSLRSSISTPRAFNVVPLSGTAVGGVWKHGRTLTAPMWFPPKVGCAFGDGRTLTARMWSTAKAGSVVKSSPTIGGDDRSSCRFVGDNDEGDARSLVSRSGRFGVYGAG